MRRLVPNFIIDRYKANELRGSFHGAAIFVDLSGFSKMTDALSEHGQHGAEVLAEMMSLIFEPLVSAVYAQHGFVIGYAGDAFNAVFPEEPAQGQVQNEAVLRCLSALISMQEHIRTHSQFQTPYGTFPISIKAGMGFGETKWQIFKSSELAYLTYWFRGDSLNGAVLAEENARPGDIIADAVSYSQIKDDVDVESANACYRIIKVKTLLPAPASFSQPEIDSVTMDLFFPESVSLIPITGEFRQVINLFVDIPINISDETLVTPFMEAVFALQEQYGGFFLRPDLGDKGFNLLMFWGAPVARERDVERALNFIIDLAARTKLPLRAGITYRTAYAGFIGASLREDYTAYGWGVNLAARLMTRAQNGEFLIDEEIARRAEALFDIKYLDEFSFKGFERKQKTFALLGKKVGVRTIYQGELVGRESELETLASFIEPLRAGEFSGALVIRGEAGIGKSRLVHAFQDSEVFKDFPSQWILCQTEEMLRQSFNPFKAWLNKRFGFVEGETNDANSKTFTRVLNELISQTPDADLASELERTASVLAALLNITQPDSLYESLDSKGRYENTLIALSVLLRAESLQTPLVVFIEDIHWLDDATREFLSYFVRTVLAEEYKQYPISLIATQRPENDPVQLGDFEILVLEIGKLSSSSISELASNILGAPVSDSLLALFETRADGNPFFAEQIIRFLSEQGSLSLGEDGKYYASQQAQTSLPTDVRAVLIARLDQLTQHVRETVQTASVLGREFELRLLAQMLREDRELPQNVKYAERANIWAPLTEIEYLFRHALLRDSMQLQSRQRELHRLAVSAMLTLYADDLEPHYAELAFHSEHAEIKDKAQTYLTLAGKASADAYQNSQALDYFTRALAVTTVDELRVKLDLLFDRAIIYSRLGNRPAQLEDLNSLEDICEKLGDVRALAHASLLRADYFFTISEFSQAIDSARRGMDLAQSVDDTEIALDAYRIVPLSQWRQGRLDDAMQFARTGLGIVQRMGKKLDEGSILNTMGLIALEQKESSLAEGYFGQALTLAREIPNRTLETKALNNLGNFEGFIRGDYARARQYYEQSSAIIHERGDRALEGIAQVNLGWVAGMQGDFVAARAFHRNALSIAREVGNRYQEMYTLINLGAVTGVQKEADLSLQYAEQARLLSLKVGDRAGEAWSHFYIGHAYLLMKQFPEARAAFSESIVIREEAQQINLVMEARAGLIETALEQNDPSAALVEAEIILAHLANAGTLDGTEEPLRIYFAVYLALKNAKDPRAKSILQTAKQILDGQVSLLKDESSRAMYVQNVPWRKAIQGE
jgi:class 3 adenylate cyclase/tetratricopeptide (TPR) repeat protein/PII-like signaling protein